MNPKAAKSDWLASWCAPDAIVYRESLRYGKRLNKGKLGDFILKAIGAAEIVCDVAREGNEADLFTRYFHAFREGDNLDAEAERAFARAVAPLVFGSKQSRALLRRIIDCVERRDTDLPTQTLEVRRILKSATAERLNARRRDEEMPTLRAIVENYHAAGGTIKNGKEIKKYLRKLGVMYLPSQHRGPDSKPRKKRVREQARINLLIREGEQTKTVAKSETLHITSGASYAPETH